TSRRPSEHAAPKRRFVLAFGLIVAALVGAFLWRRHSDSGGASSASPAASASAAAERVVPVITVKAERKDVPVYLDGLGNAQPLATVTVKSQVDGRLDSVNFKEGQPVKKGELLAQVDPRPFVIALHQAEAALAKDDAAAKNAHRNLERYTNLV